MRVTILHSAQARISSNRWGSGAGFSAARSAGVGRAAAEAFASSTRVPRRASARASRYWCATARAASRRSAANTCSAEITSIAISLSLNGDEFGGKPLFKSGKNWKSLARQNKNLLTLLGGRSGTESAGEIVDYSWSWSTSGPAHGAWPQTAKTTDQHAFAPTRLPAWSINICDGRPPSWRCEIVRRAGDIR
jgi:hypothetical protein